MTQLSAPPARRRPFARFLRLGSLGALAFALFVLVWGWTVRVRAPAVVAAPAQVYVLHDELHRAVLLPTDAGFVEFGFGDWEWYARAQDRWYHVFATVLWPTPGTLSRREHAAKNGDELRASMPWATFGELVVDAGKAAALRNRLQAQFDAGARDVVYRTGLHMQFVPWDRGYWFGDNCSHVVVEWLRELDCTMSWVPLCLDVAAKEQHER